MLSTDSIIIILVSLFLQTCHSYIPIKNINFEECFYFPYYYLYTFKKWERKWLQVQVYLTSSQHISGIHIRHKLLPDGTGVVGYDLISKSEVNCSRMVLCGVGSFLAIQQHAHSTCDISMPHWMIKINHS